MQTVAERNKAVIQRFLEAWNRRDIDALQQQVVPHVVRHCPATPHVQVRSFADLKAFLQQDSAIFPDSVQMLVHAVAEGDMVATWATYEGTQQGPMGPLPATGIKVKFEFAAIFRLENEKIIEWWATWDNLGVLQALGHVPGG